MAAEIILNNCQISIHIEIGMNSTVALPATARIDTINMDMNGKVIKNDNQ